MFSFLLKELIFFFFFFFFFFAAGVVQCGGRKTCPGHYRVTDVALLAKTMTHLLSYEDFHCS